MGGYIVVMKSDPYGRDRRRAADKGRREDDVLVREYQNKKDQPNLVALPPVKRTPLPPRDMRRLERAEQIEEEFLLTASVEDTISEQGSEILVLHNPKFGVEKKDGTRRIFLLNLRPNCVPAKGNGHTDRYKVSGGPAQYSRC